MQDLQLQLNNIYLHNYEFYKACTPTNVILTILYGTCMYFHCYYPIVLGRVFINYDNDGFKSNLCMTLASKLFFELICTACKFCYNMILLHVHLDCVKLFF